MASRSYDQENSLCARCKTLDITAVRTSTHKRLPLGLVRDWQPELCAFCRFLVKLLSLKTSVGQTEDDAYFLFSKKTRILPDKIFQILDHRLIVLSVSENGLPPDGVPYIAAHTGNLPSWSRTIQPTIDFSQAREWLRVCAHLHGKHCSGEKTYSFQNLRLIKCATGEVVQATNQEPYVALSYVWGDKQHTSVQGNNDYPKTIQDARIATIELGYEWLWVDQYCINQNESSDLSDQLQQMDVIYQQAAVTIIAAAGENAHYGLPGVNGNFRKPTDTVRVGDEHLYVIPRPEMGLKNSKWIERGWTYQEGLLSMRRLVFTDEQLYYECQGCYCAETLDISLEDFKRMHAHDKPWLRKRYRTDGRLGMFPLNGCGVDPWDIYIRITEFSDRSLSKEHDILNGILGIFRAFERMPNSMRHLYGIPFPKGTMNPNETKFITDSKFTMPIFSEGLRWFLKAPSKRRQGFPSWSWTGWYGKVHWPVEYTDDEINRTPSKLGRPRNPKVNENALRLSFESDGRAAMSWAEFQDNYHHMFRVANHLGGFINIDAFTTVASHVLKGGHVHLETTTIPANQEPNFLLRCSDGKQLAVLADVTTANDLRPNDTFLAVHIHRSVKGNQISVLSKGPDGGATRSPIVTLHFLIVQQMESHWERVALASCVINPERELWSEWRSLRLG